MHICRLETMYFLVRASGAESQQIIIQSLHSWYIETQHRRWSLYEQRGAFVSDSPACLGYDNAVMYSIRLAETYQRIYASGN